MPRAELGLTTSEAKERLNKFGQNVLPEKPPPSDIKILLSQFTNPFVYVLIAAGFVTLLLGHTADTIIILLAVVVNAILGFVQERKAGRALYALKKLVHPEALLVRDGKQVKIPVEEVVPGDVCILNQGSKIPADGKLVFSNRLYINEAIITGESVPVAKKRNEEVYMGTIVAVGRGKLLVESTGAATKIGQIATSVQEVSEDTPLRKQIKQFSRQLLVLVIVLTVFVFLAGVVKNQPLDQIFTASVALAVSAIPEGLLIGLTVVLAVGMQRILKRKGLIRKLLSAETLGGVTTICVDKTGTLTQGQMEVVGVVGDTKKAALQVFVANDLDDPIVIAAHSWAKGNLKNTDDIKNKYTSIDSIPFSPKDRYFTSLNKWDKTHNMLFVNGAPEYLIEWSDLSSSEKVELEKKIKELTGKGRRIMGLARKRVPVSKTKISQKDIKNSFEWIGLLEFTDPVRSGVESALVKTRSAGIRLLVITGDYPQTAVSVMKELGLNVSDENVILGKDLEKIDKDSLAQKLVSREDVYLFARTTPEQKLRIIEALKQNKEVVAMMGDGVNDAPALAKADIGIVVGEATDVAKETADLVLLDSDFSTIIAAIEEGRGIYDNIRKIILYLMSDAFEEIVAVVGAILIGLPLPVTAAQILWINLVSDGLPDLALTIDPKAENILSKRPRSHDDPLVAWWMKELILIVSLIGGLVALALFAYAYSVSGDLVLAQSIAFATLGINSLIYVYSIRTLREPFWRQNPFVNKWLNLAVLGGLFLQFLPFATETTREFFGLVMLTPAQWVVVVMASIFMFIIIEVIKSLTRHRFTKI